MHVELDVLDDQLGRLTTDPPSMWLTGWIADYVGPNDFLGVLLESDSSNNYGQLGSTAFDQAIADALGTRDAATAQAAYERAQAEVQREVPGRAAVRRDAIGAGSRWVAGCRATTGSGSCAWRGWRGRT